MGGRGGEGKGEGRRKGDGEGLGGGGEGALWCSQPLTLMSLTPEKAARAPAERNHPAGHLGRDLRRDNWVSAPERLTDAVRVTWKMRSGWEPVAPVHFLPPYKCPADPADGVCLTDEQSPGHPWTSVRITGPEATRDRGHPVHPPAGRPASSALEGGSLSLPSCPSLWGAERTESPGARTHHQGRSYVFLLFPRLQVLPRAKGRSLTQAAQSNARKCHRLTRWAV